MQLDTRRLFKKTRATPASRMLGGCGALPVQHQCTIIVEIKKSGGNKLAIHMCVGLATAALSTMYSRCLEYDLLENQS